MTKEEFLIIINADPDGVKDSQDGSYKFIPISAIEAKLDEIFYGEWSWDFQRELFGKGYAIGKGLLSYRHPVSGEWLHKSGTAGVVLSKEVTMDYPRLEAQALLNSVKKIGPVFGRNLNRDKDDAEVGVIFVDKEENLDEELAIQIAKVSEFSFKEEAEAYIQGTNWKYNAVIKKIISKKPSNSDGKE